MSRNLSKWGVLYFWKKHINKELFEQDMEFDEIICVKKSNIDKNIYVGYFTVKNNSYKKDIIFGKYIVQFKYGNIYQCYMMLCTNNDKSYMSEIEDNTLIFDKRKDFPWIWT